MQLGLGRTESEENEKELHKLSAKLKGQCGLFFTTKTKEEVLKWFANYSALEYARSGFKATETVELEEGPLEEFTHSIEPHLRSLGMPVKLTKGVVTLYKDHTVCEEGKVLTPEQARILKLIGRPMATFSLTIKAYWSKEDGFEMLAEDEDEDEDTEKVGKESGNNDDEDVMEQDDDE